MTCASVPTLARIEEGPYKTFALIVAILFPMLLTIQLTNFLYMRKSSVFLRKRSIPILAQMYVGSLGIWGYTSLYDAVGSDKYPCWLLQLLHWFAPPFVAVANIFQTSMYLSEISLSRLKRSLREDGSEQAMRFTQELEEQKLSKQTTFAISQGFKAHLKYVFRLPVPENNRLEAKVRNVQFINSKMFVVWWATVAFLPFTIAFIVRMKIGRAHV